MRLWCTFFIVCAYIFGLVTTNPADAFAKPIKVTITHTHEVSSHQHHAHDDDHHDDHHHHEDADDDSGVPHSHEISISYSVPVIAPNSVTLVFSLPAGETFPRAFNDRTPKHRSLGSIFRPPIA